MGKSMKEQVEQDEQMALMEVGPENRKEIVEAVRIYKGHQSDRIIAGKKEVKQRDVVKALIKKSGLKPLQDGTIKFTYGMVTICVTPRDELITITEKKPKKSKKKKAKK